MGNLSTKTKEFIEKERRREPFQSLTKEEKEIWFLQHTGTTNDAHIDYKEDIQIPARDGHMLNATIIYPNAETKRPTLLWFTGSLFLTSNYEHIENKLREIAITCNMTVIAVSYRMEPFPTPLNDCIDAIEWAHTNAELFHSLPDEMVVCGDGFGASLVASIEQQIQHTHDFIKAICLFYPAVDPFLLTDSKRAYGEGFLLETEWLQAFYTQMTEHREPNATIAPLHGLDFSNHCPTFIMKAEFDPLRDEAILYEHKLENAGVKVLRKTEENTIHGFFAVGGLNEKQTTQIIHDIDHFLKSL